MENCRRRNLVNRLIEISSAKCSPTIYPDDKSSVYFKQMQDEARDELARIFHETKNPDERKKILKESGMNRVEIWEKNHPRTAIAIYAGTASVCVAEMIYEIYCLFRR